MITPRCHSLWLAQSIFGVSMFLFLASLQPAPSPTPTLPGPVDEKLFKGIPWRQVGPLRGERALAIEGVPREPAPYYFGAVAGGSWATATGGAHWTPLLDLPPTSSL